MTTVILLASCWPRLAFGFGQASGPTDPPGTLKLGPIAAHPKISVSPFGIESNVFNQPSDPKSDRTFAVLPSVDVSMHVGRGTFVSATAASWTGYRVYGNQGSKNIAQDGRFELPLNRVTLRALFGLASIRERPSLEIDFRARRFVASDGLSADVQLLSKTVIRVEAVGIRTTFRDGIVNQISLPAALNRTSRAANLSVRHELSALTTVVLSGEWLRDRFELTPTRNATGFRIMPGVEFSKFALISGTASVGYRHFQPASPDVPPYGGVAAGVHLASVIRETMRLSAEVDRDVAYSYTVDQPYYIQTNVSGSVAYRLGVRWETVATVGMQRLAYRLRSGPPVTAGVVAPPVPRDTGRNYDLSVGYHLRPGLQLAMDVRQSSRQSMTAKGSYTGWQVGSLITYGY